MPEPLSPRSYPVSGDNVLLGQPLGIHFGGGDRRRKSGSDSVDAQEVASTVEPKKSDRHAENRTPD